VSDGLDLLIHRHLDGTLSEEEAKALQERLRGDVDARRRLAEMAFEHAQLKEVLEPAKKAKPTSFAWNWVAAASILLVVAVALAVGTPKRETPDVTPAVKDVKKPTREGFQGFRGRVHARVLDRRDKVRILLKVGEVLAVRDASEAAAPAGLVGESIGIPLPRLKDGEPPGADRDHAMFLAKLQTGQEVVLELRHLEGPDFAIVSLTEEQVEWARRDDRKKAPKEGMKDAPRETPKKTEKEDR
jgi:hypothetical protein